MAEFPKTLSRKRDGAERVVDNAREQVAAEFDGFAAVTPAEKAAATRARNKPAAKGKPKGKPAATERGEVGPPAAKTAAPKTAPATASAPAVTS